MQINSGPSPLSLALLKALGAESPATPAAATPASATNAPGTAAKASVRPAVPQAAARPAAESSADLGMAKNIPRGSFIDIRA